MSSLEESIKHQRQTSTTLLEISALEFELTGSQFKEKLKDPDAWDRLARKQQLLLYLVLEGYGMEECAEYFGVSKGHIYNKRWEFRRLFDLDEAADFTTLLK